MNLYCIALHIFIYYAQKSDSFKGNFSRLVKNDLENLNINLNEEGKKIDFLVFQNYVKSKTTQACILHLLKIQKSKKNKEKNKKHKI